MSIQTLIATSAAGLAAFYFLRGAFLDLREGNRPGGSPCGTCSSGGCPAARVSRLTR